jgi:Tfp pilus assembly protein PilF
MRKTIIIILSCVAILLASYAGHRSYRVWKSKHLMNLARDFVANSDFRNAALSVQAVLRSDPNNLEATRMMAQFADASRSPAALIWRSRAVEMDPHSLNDRLALAQTALVHHDYTDATNALEGVDDADKKTAAYQNVAGTVAASANHLAAAETYFLEASRLDPQNPAPQLSLAVVRLHTSNTLELAEARNTLDRLASNPTNSVLRCKALRELTQDAMSHHLQDSALALSKQLTHETNCTFPDRILQLEVLKEARSGDFKATLDMCQREAANKQGEISELATWEMAKTSPADALSWLRSLPINTQTNQPTTLLIAECYTEQRDWRRLQGWLDCGGRSWPMPGKRSGTRHSKRQTGRNRAS